MLRDNATWATICLLLLIVDIYFYFNTDVASEKFVLFFVGVIFYSAGMAFVDMEKKTS